MANPTLISSAIEMTDVLFEGVVCPYQLSIADSELPEAGFGLFAREEIPAGMEVFRAMPVVSVV